MKWDFLEMTANRHEMHCDREIDRQISSSQILGRVVAGGGWWWLVVARAGRTRLIGGVRLVTVATGQALLYTWCSGYL